MTKYTMNQAQWLSARARIEHICAAVFPHEGQRKNVQDMLFNALDTNLSLN